MAWSSSDRKSELPPNWDSLRKEVLVRDKHKCQWFDTKTKRRCLAPANQVDHKKRGNDHSKENLQSLCEPHHQRKTLRESAEARRQERQRRRDLMPPADKHPGLL